MELRQCIAVPADQETRRIVQIAAHSAQLTGLAVFAGCHLAGNGDQRSILLFGGLLCWAVAEIIFISRREGEWQKPEPQPVTALLKPAIGSLVVYIVLRLAHPLVAGVTV